MTSTDDADRFLDGHGQARLRYRDEGYGPAVLLVHGWLLDLTMWDALAASLVDRFRVIRWDRRGFGESTGVPDLATDAADARRLLDFLGVQRTAVVGLSQACRIALNIVEQEPARIACLILDGAPPVEGLPDRQWHNETPVLEYRALLIERGVDALRTELAQHPLLRLHAQGPGAQQRMDSMLARYAGADLMALAPGPPPVATAGRFGRITVPVLVLSGALDTAQRLLIGETLAACLPDAQRQVVPGSGHMACWDNPEAYNESVGRFLTKHSQRWA